MPQYNSGTTREPLLALLLDFGFHPDERTRLGAGTGEPELTWGMPLWHCASSGRHAAADLLLVRGADLNTARNSRLGRLLTRAILGRVSYVVTVSDEFRELLASL